MSQSVRVHCTFQVRDRIRDAFSNHWCRVRRRAEEGPVESLYFDTNLFDHMRKGYVAQDVRAGLLTAIERRKKAVLFSIANVEETFHILESSSVTEGQIIREQLSIMRGVVDRNRFIKPWGQLLRDDIRSFAMKLPLPSPFIEDPKELRILAGNIDALANADYSRDTALVSTVAKVHEQKKPFYDSMTTNLLRVPESVKRMRSRERPSFIEYFGKHALIFAEKLTQDDGTLELCRKRGSEGLLEIRSVRLYVGAALSLNYSYVLEGRVPKLGDSRDLLHLLSASAADVFVSHDKGLRHIAKRIPISHFTILTLQEVIGN